MIVERIILAKRLLAHSPDPVAKISSDLGFDEPTKFVKLFRRETTLTPPLRKSCWLATEFDVRDIAPMAPPYVHPGRTNAVPTRRLGVPIDWLEARCVARADHRQRVSLRVSGTRGGIALVPRR